MRTLNIGNNPLPEQNNLGENIPNNNSNKPQNPLMLLLIIPLLVGGIFLGNYLSKKTGDSFNEKRKDILKNKIEEQKKEKTTKEFVIKTDCSGHETIIYSFNGKEKTAKQSERIQEGTTAPECLFKIKKEKGTYSFNDFFQLQDNEISISNWSYGMGGKKNYTVSITVNDEKEQTYKIDHITYDPTDVDHLYFDIENNLIKRIDFNFLEGKSAYITITNSSISLKSDEHAKVYVDFDTDNKNKGHAKVLNLDLNNNPIEIKVDEKNNYSIKENNNTRTLPLTYRVEFVDVENGNVDVEEGNKIPRPETREGYYWKCQGSNSEGKEWNFDTDLVKEDLFCRNIKRTNN